MRVISFDPEVSSLNKQETFYDTVKAFDSFGVDALVIRHKQNEYYKELEGKVDAAILNGGDGTGNHPTQSLLDLLTIKQEFGRFEGLKVAIIGDVAHSRVAHTNYDIMRKLGMEVVVSGPEFYLDEGYESEDFEKAITTSDVVMLLRIQFERDATLGDMFAKGENDKLRKSFKAYEGYYLTIATIMFSATLFLITPFISLYTKGITDANYIVPEFAAIMVLAEFVWAIRQPYNDLIKVAGHFKQTRVGAWVEAISNMVISFILVWKFGLVGVAIGTLFAMAFRTMEFMYHTSKYILNRSIWESFKRLIVIGLEVGVLALILNIIPKIEIVSYQTWALYSVAVASISAILVITTNCLIFKPCFLGHPKKT